MAPRGGETFALKGGETPADGAVRSVAGRRLEPELLGALELGHLAVVNDDLDDAELEIADLVLKQREPVEGGVCGRGWVVGSERHGEKEWCLEA